MAASRAAQLLRSMSTSGGSSSRSRPVSPPSDRSVRKSSISGAGTTSAAPDTSTERGPVAEAKRSITAVNSPRTSAITPISDVAGQARDSSVRCYCRIRPLLRSEATSGDRGEFLITENGTVMTSEGYGRGTAGETTLTKTKDYVFDGVLGPASQQRDVFELIARPVVNGVLEGVNGTVFAYGQSGSGKTHTMLGPDITDDFEAGVLPRCIRAIFEGVEEAPESMSFTVRMSCVEIYMERIRDLLNIESQSLQIRQHPDRGIHVVGAREEYVASADEMLALVAQAAANRAVAATGMNENSSRSHQVTTVTIETRDGESGAMRFAKLCLVDLAGSEQVRRTHATGLNLDEAKVINSSLSALGNVINALASRRDTPSARTSHVPYRDSKLTRLLQDSLGGNSRTSLVICCSPSLQDARETTSTLRFGTRAQRVQNRAIVNRVRTADEMQQQLWKAEEAIEIQASLIKQLRTQLLRLIARSKKSKAAQKSKTQTMHAALARSVSAQSSSPGMTGRSGPSTDGSPSTQALSELGRGGGASDDNSSVISGVSGITARGGAVLELAETKSRMEQLMASNAQLLDDMGQARNEIGSLAKELGQKNAENLRLRMENAELKRCLQIAEDALISSNVAGKSTAAARAESMSTRTVQDAVPLALPSSKQIKALLREEFPQGMPKPWVQAPGVPQHRYSSSSHATLGSGSGSSGHTAIPRTIEDVRQAMEQAAAEASEARREATSARSRVQALRTELEELRATHETAISQHHTELARMRVAAPLLALDDPSAGGEGLVDAQGTQRPSASAPIGSTDGSHQSELTAAPHITATAAAALIREVVPRSLPSVGKDPARRAAGLERIVLEQSISVRAAHERLTAIMTTHRQLLRKYAVVDVECSQRGEAIAARDERLARMQQENSRLNDRMGQLREQARAKILSGRPGDLMVMGGMRSLASAGGDADGMTGSNGGVVYTPGHHGGRVVKPLRGGRRQSANASGSGSGFGPGLSQLRVESGSQSSGGSAHDDVRTPGRTEVASKWDDEGRRGGLGQVHVQDRRLSSVDERPLTPSSEASREAAGEPGLSAAPRNGKSGGTGGGGGLTPRLRAIAAQRKRQLNSSGSGSASGSAYHSGGSDGGMDKSHGSKSDGVAEPQKELSFATGWVDIDDSGGGRDRESSSSGSPAGQVRRRGSPRAATDSHERGTLL